MTAWFDLTYPKGDPDAVIVTKEDFLLLNPNEFVSDTIIDFYIKYLQSRLPEHEKKRVHVFNSFFFRKLAYFDRDRTYDLEGTSSLFEHMKRWTRDINIFAKDFLFIPIMQSAHWSLVIVCYPKNLFKYEHQNGYMETLILHFDSMEGFHKGVEETVKKYLVQHWAHTIPMGTSRNDKSCDVKCIQAKVPQQTNFSDCGLFMLHYVELFLRALQSKVSTIKASRNWFDPEDVANKRSMLQRLITEIQATESAGKDVVKHVDTLLEKPIQDVSAVSEKVLSDDFFLETDVRSNQKEDSSCHSGLLEPVDHASHELVCCQLAHAVSGNQLGNAFPLRAATRTFEEEDLRKPSTTCLVVENINLTADKDQRKMIDICGDLDVSTEELNEMQDSQSEGSVTNAKNTEADEMHVSSNEVEEDDGGPYNLMRCGQGATSGCKLPCKEWQTLPQANDHGVFCDYAFTGVSRGAIHLKSNLASKMDYPPNEEQGDSSRGSSHYAHGPNSQSQVYISSDEDNEFMKIVKAAKLRQQRKQRKAGGPKGMLDLVPNDTSKRIEKRPPNAKWRMRRMSSIYFK